VLVYFNVITSMPEFWWKRAKIYELYIDKFAGTINGLREKLPYFTALGIDTLHLLPHFASPMVDEGYDIMDYRSVRPELGTMEDFELLVKEARAQGIRIIIDFVLNHTSNQHPWFVEAKQSKKNPKRDYYLWREIEYGFEGSTNAFPDIKPNNWIWNEETKDYYFATFYPEQPDLNWDNEEVQREMLANMDFWIDKGVSGFRLDAAPYLIKRENSTSKGLPETHAVIKRIRAHIEAKNPEVILLAEAHQSLALTKEYFGHGDECHMAYHFPLMEQFWVSLMEQTAEGVHEMVEASRAIPDNCQWATFLRNHDEVSLATLPPGVRTALVNFLDPQHTYLFKKAGATSVRLAEGLHNDDARIREALSLLYTTPGAPIMYYGDEIGMRNLPLKDGVIDTRLYVRGEFDWNAADAQMKDPRSLWSHATHLTRGAVPSALSLEI
jgi:maltose alpha-D-glucosyltransferase/alpha-amylase